MQDNGSAVVVFFFARNPWQKAGGGSKSRRPLFAAPWTGRVSSRGWIRIVQKLVYQRDQMRCESISIRFNISLSLSPPQRVRSKSISRCPRASRSHSPRQTFALSSIIRLHKLYPHSFPSPSRDQTRERESGEKEFGRSVGRSVEIIQKNYRRM